MLSIIVLSFNRRDVLRRTLDRLQSIAPRITGGSELIVADNSSTDRSADMVEAHFPAVRLLRLPQNVGVAAFNRAAEIAGGDLLLILDDDAWPDEASLTAGLSILSSDPTMAGVALSPVHPGTGAAEWRFLQSPTRHCPVMGCGNLVRTAAWNQVGGYEEAFFLYRNDTDLALKLLGAGHRVCADPSWIVWHDSPHAARKSDRWLELATKNWALLARRHARGWRLPFAIILGWLSSSRYAGLDFARLRLATKGALAGLTSRLPPLSHSVQRDGRAFAELLRLQLQRRDVAVPCRPFEGYASVAPTTASNMPRHSP